MLDACLLLEKGVRWRVGSGRTIRIVGDRWLPRPTTFPVMTGQRTLSERATVGALIVEGGGARNEGLVWSEFNNDDANCILLTPLGSASDTDTRMWRFEKDGQFSVCSVCYLTRDRLQKPSHQQLQESTLAGPMKWKFIWGALVPPKIEVFAWRVCLNSLPTVRNLRRRGMVAAQDVLRRM